MEKNIIVMKCPQCGEAMPIGGICESCGYNDGSAVQDAGTAGREEASKT